MRSPPRVDAAGSLQNQLSDKIFLGRAPGRGTWAPGPQAPGSGAPGLGATTASFVTLLDWIPTVMPYYHTCIYMAVSILF